MNCTACGKPMDPSARFCSHCGTALNYQAAYPTPERLFRPRYGRMIAGVCAGFAQHFGWEVTIVRLALVVAVLLGCGLPIVAYFIAWIVMPNGAYFFPTPPQTTTVTPAPTPDGQTGATI